MSSVPLTELPLTDSPRTDSPRTGPVAVPDLPVTPAPFTRLLAVALGRLAGALVRLDTADGARRNAAEAVALDRTRALARTEAELALVHALHRAPSAPSLPA